MLKRMQESMMNEAVQTPPGPRTTEASAASGTSWRPARPAPPPENVTPAHAPGLGADTFREEAMCEDCSQSEAAGAGAEGTGAAPSGGAAKHASRSGGAGRGGKAGAANTRKKRTNHVPENAHRDRVQELRTTPR